MLGKNFWRGNPRIGSALPRARTAALLLALAGGGILPALQAQPDTRPPLQINITAPAVEEQWRQTPASVTVVEDSETRGAQNLSLEQSLQRVPGVFAQNRFNFAQGLRLSIRGFGARGNFGVRGVRVLVDGVPLTLPDGQTELDALDLGLLERVEVIRGPASTLYGNGAGGVLSVQTRDAPDSPHAAFELAGGELGFRRLRAEGGTSWGSVNGLAAVNATRLDGFRERSNVDSEIYTGKLAVPFSAGELRLKLNAIEIDSQDPGALTAEQVRADRSQAAPNNIAFDGGESISQQRLSAVWQGRPGNGREYQINAYAGQREFANRLPFTNGGQVAFDRVFGGLGARHGWRLVWLGLAQQLTAGFNLEAQQDERSRFDNLQGVRGPRTLRQDEKASSWGVFVHDDISLSRYWRFSLGARYDRVRLSVDDFFRSDGNDSGAREFDDFSFSAGLSYEFLTRQHLYARVSTSFETPTNGELANPGGGGFNPALESTEATNYELGVKGEGSAYRYELVVYHIRLEDELIAFELPGESGRSFFRNAGESRRNGLEISADWQPHAFWSASLAYTWVDYEFEDFNRDGMQLAGNEIPGIPRQQAFAELAFARDGYYARLNTELLDRQFADDANTVEVSGYGLLNLRTGWQGTDSGWQVEPYLGIDNILDKDYNDNVRINAFGGRFFEPAPGRYFYAGLRASLQ